jgi:hypothetical protein
VLESRAKVRILCDSCGALSEARLIGRPGGAVLVCATCGAEAALAEGPAAEAPPAANGATPTTGAPADAGEEPAWSALLAAWDDEAAHRAFLARAGDLEALARAGARYREVLATRPGDAAALRGRDEVLRRATALGLAELPRAPDRRPVPSAVKWGVVAILAGTLIGAAAWVVWTLIGLGAVR